MANIIWTPPEGWVEETGAHVSFTAPCNCVDAGNLVILLGEDENGDPVYSDEYEIVDATGTCITGSGGIFASDAILEFILDCENLKAYLQNSSISCIFDKIYPVGSIYMSVNNTDPGDLFGGTWSQLTDRFLIGAGSSYDVNDTGGEEEHTLTVSEMPSHKHTVTISNNGEHYHSYGQGSPCRAADGSYWNTAGSGASTYSDTTSDDGSHSHTATVGDTGGGTAFSIMPPYLAVYMWKRTA